MTLQERLRASAKELVRLLEEDIANIDKLRDEARETAAEYTGKDKPVARFFKKLEEMGIRSVEVKLDNGKAFERKEFMHGMTGGLSKSMIMLDAMREIQRLRARVATLETLLQPDQHVTDNQPGNDTIQPLYRSLGLLCDPVCNSIARPCARRGESPCPELSEILMKPDTMIVCHLIIPITGQEDRVATLEVQCKRSLREPSQDQSAASESSFSVSEGTGDQPEACPGTPDRSPLLSPEFRALVNQQMRLTRRIYDEVQGLIKRSQPKLRQPQMPKETDGKRRTSAHHQ